MHLNNLNSTCRTRHHVLSIALDACIETVKMNSALRILKYISLFEPHQSKILRFLTIIKVIFNKTANRVYIILVTRVFPRYRQFASFNFEF